MTSDEIRLSLWDVFLLLIGAKIKGIGINVSMWERNLFTLNHRVK